MIAKFLLTVSILGFIASYFPPKDEFQCPKCYHLDCRKVSGGFICRYCGHFEKVGRG